MIVARSASFSSPMSPWICGSLLTLILLGGGVSGSAWGDILRLKNGNELEGRVTLLADGNYRVFMEEGRIVLIPSIDVVKQITAEAPIDRLQRSLKELAPQDRDGLVELAAWAERKGLHKSVVKVYRRILTLDPHHPLARERLGYVAYRNRWVPRDELEENGLLRFRGGWKTPSEVEKIREKESVGEVRALFADIHHDNRYLRQHALLRLFANDDSAIVSTLLQLVKGKDPLERMVAARVLGNHPFSVGGRTIYEALLAERHYQVTPAFIRVLGSFGDGTLGEWAAVDLARPPGNASSATSTTAIDNLFQLAANYPHRAMISPILSYLERPGWDSRADRLLHRMLGVPDHSPVQWQSYWQQYRTRMPLDLGKAWIKN